MSLQIRRGTQSQLGNITPVQGELIYTTDTKQVFVGDGSTAGGIAIAVGGSGTITASLVGNVTGNIAGQTLSASGNVLTGNLYATANISATGNVLANNVVGNFFFGNGSLLTGITTSTSKIFNGTSEANIGVSNGNANITINGTSNVVVVSNIGVNVLGNVVASGNLTGGNILATAAYSGTGNITGGNILTAGLISSTGNATHGNVLVNGIISASGGITATTVSASGNINGANLLIAATMSSAANIYTNTSLHVNNDAIIGGNVSAISHTGTIVSVTGNITGNYYFGNGSQLSGVVVGAASNIANGNSNIVIGNSANVAVSVGGSSNIVVWGTTGEYVTGVVSATGNVTGGNILTNGSISAGGNLTANTLLVNASANILGNLNVQGNITFINSNVITTNDLQIQLANNVSDYANINSAGLVAGPAGNALTFWQYSYSGNTWVTNIGISATGNIRGGNLSVGTGTITVGNIVNANGNAVGNIGAAGAYFNTIFGKATTALYADLAECYLGDAYYAPGTVVSFGGPEEVTFCDQDQDPAVAGVVSTDPAYKMNSGLQGEHVVTVALMGRVPCQVVGPIAKGDLLVSAGNGRARSQTAPAAGTIIGKALQAFDGDTGTVEIVVGRV